MTRRREKPGLSAAGAAAEAQRRERLAAALRENLRKRKAQKQGRDKAAEQIEVGWGLRTPNRLSLGRGSSKSLSNSAPWRPANPPCRAGSAALC